MSIIRFEAILEINLENGIIYLNHPTSEKTFIRIQGLPSPIPHPTSIDFYDIKVLDSETSWTPKKS